MCLLQVISDCSCASGYPEMTHSRGGQKEARHLLQILPKVTLSLAMGQVYKGLIKQSQKYPLEASPGGHMRRWE